MSGRGDSEYATRLAKELIGERLAAAVNAVGAWGTFLRVLREDDVGYAQTMEWAPSRSNVTVDAGVVTSAHVG